MKKVAVFLLCLSPLAADVVVLKEGRGFVGDIVSRDEEIVVIETTSGTVSIPARNIASISASPSVVRAYKEKSRAAVSAEDHYALALWCIRNGYESAARKEYGIAVRLDPTLEGKNPFPSPGDGERQREETIRRGIRMGRILSELRRTRDPHKREWYRKRLSAFSPGEKKPVLESQLRLTTPSYSSYRGLVLDELAAMPEPDPKVFIEHILREPEVSLRKKAIGILGTIPDGRRMLERAMIRAVAAGDEYDLLARVNAEETLGTIRSEAGTAVLIRRLKMHWGPSARAHYARFTSHAYIRDVTPVVAADATSFKPTVGLYTTGVVLDAKVRSVEREVIIRSLQEITGMVLPDAASWIGWWEEKGRAHYAGPAREKRENP